MKKLLLFILLLSPIFLFAQSNPETNKTPDKYCMVVAAPKTFGGLKITLDYGQDQSTYTAFQLKETGTFAGFKSVVEALNYMSQQGWEFVNSYSVPFGGSKDFVLHYVFRRKGAQA